MASISTTEANSTIDEKWNREIEDARYAGSVALNRIANKSGDVDKSGDIIHVTIQARTTTGAVGANGAFVPQAWTPTTQDVTVNQNRQWSVETEDIVKAQSWWDPDSEAPKIAGQAFAEYYDVTIFGQHTSVTGVTPSGNVENPKAFGKNAAGIALLRLADANIPKEDLSFFIPPIGYYGGIWNETQLTDAEKTGLPKSILTSGFQDKLGGVPVYSSTAIATAGTKSQTRVGLLLHKSCIAFAFQRNNMIRRADRVASLVDSYVVLVKSLWGLSVIRNDHGVRIYIAANPAA